MSCGKEEKVQRRGDRDIILLKSVTGSLFPIKSEKRISTFGWNTRAIFVLLKCLVTLVKMVTPCRVLCESDVIATRRTSFVVFCMLRGTYYSYATTGYHYTLGWSCFPFTTISFPDRKPFSTPRPSVEAKVFVYNLRRVPTRNLYYVKKSEKSLLLLFYYIFLPQETSVLTIQQFII